MDSKTSWKNKTTKWNLRINFFIYCGHFVLILVVFVLFLLSLRFGQISLLAFFRWLTATSDRTVESCNRIPVITAFYSCCQSHHVFDQVNLWPAWVRFETAIFWQSSPGTVAQRIEALCLYGSWWALSEDSGFKSYPSRPEVYLVKNMVR